MPYCRTNGQIHYIHSMRFTHKTFGGFIYGKLLDSAIIGVLCYIGMLTFAYAISNSGQCYYRCDKCYSVFCHLISELSLVFS